MSINRYKPHLIVLPEDRANEEIANGFIQSSNVNSRAIQIERPANGWIKVKEKFRTDLVPEMRQFTNSIAVLLIDFDCREDRFSHVMGQIPDDLKDRVFIFGVFSEAENLKRESKKVFEKIGDTLAKGCPDKKNELWDNDLLAHNKSELERIIPSVRAFLFL